MRNFGCSNDIPAFKQDEFTGCDGKVLTDKFLRYQITAAIEKEAYEWAQRIKSELERRKRENAQVK